MTKSVLAVIPRFTAIDGLRTWMAWLVVFSHVLQQAFPTNALLPRLDLGGHAVDAFIIVSGFVITHLLLERRGSYLAYIIPRFMRLFPAFAVCCAIGAASYAAAAKWSNPVWFDVTHGQTWWTMVQYWPQHTLAHLLMLHGAIPNPILPDAQYAFDPPGWSVSLEWQFYLLAPFAVRLCRTKTGSLALVAIVIVASLAYHFALKEFWERPSILIGTGKFFLIGIACRYAAPYLAGSVAHIAATGLGLLFSLSWIGSPSIALWLLVFSFTLRSDRPAQGIDSLYIAVMRTALESKPVQWLAERSYSTYLLHWPLLVLIGTAATHWGVGSGMQLALAMTLVIPLTLLLQEPIYRFVELPSRLAGKRWARSLGARPMSEEPRGRIDPSAMSAPYLQTAMDGCGRREERRSRFTKR